MIDKPSSKNIQQTLVALHDSLGKGYQITYKRFGEIIVTIEPENLDNYIVWSVKSAEDLYLYDISLFTGADIPGHDDTHALIGKADTVDSAVRVIKKHLAPTVSD